VQIETEMQKLQQLYSVYEVHAKNVDSFSMVLWADLDVTKIIDVTEEVAAELKKKRMLSEMPLFEAVSKNIRGFLASLPLMKELKSDALRKRHWSNLMTVRCTRIYFICSSLVFCGFSASTFFTLTVYSLWRSLQVTGQEFDMDPKTFTLGSMFAMSLDKYADDILKITSAAEKELTIESELKKLVEVWGEQKLMCAKYSKGTEDRGHVLRSVDDVLLLLEDTGLNLQSMMASPFVRPFIDDVRKWEQKLGLVGECIEAWMQVQRKWMYLESIFVGSDDIRLQLPEVCSHLDP
jgi:dynein heavy chain, axonemal